MLTKIALLGLVGSAAAFNAPMMTGRREAIAGAGAAAVVAPLLRPSGASAMAIDFKAPVVEIFDERDGCSASGRKTKGGKTGGDDDRMCVKVSMQTIVQNKHLTDIVLANYETIAQSSLQYVPITDR